MRTYFTAILSLFCIAFCQSQSLAKAENLPIEGEIIVQLRAHASIDQLETEWNSRRNSSTPLFAKKTLSERSKIYLLEYDNLDLDMQGLKSSLQQHSLIEQVQFNYPVSFRDTEPNDPNYSLQNTLEKIGVPAVWDVTTGGVSAIGDTIVVAILDSGFDSNHIDFTDNVWRNRSEPIDGKDNDANGYIDDVMGWDFVADSRVLADDFHGQSVAGIIGATGNNDIGVAGINWSVKVMMFRTRNVSQIVRAYEYIVDQRSRYNESKGADGAFVVVTNASFGIDRVFCSEQPIWGAMYDKLGEVGVLTAAGAANNSYDVEVVGDMPTTCTSDFIIGLLNTNENDNKSATTAFGKTSIDLGVPGFEAYTTKQNDTFGAFAGNSSAAPHLTGVIALLYSLPTIDLAMSAIEEPKATALLMRKVILEGVDAVPDLEDCTVAGGRLNAFNSLELLQSEFGTTTGDLEILEVAPNPVSEKLRLKYETPDFVNYELRIFNTLGQTVYRKTITPNRFSAKRYEIDVSGLAVGIHFLSLGTGKEIRTVKFLKKP